LTLPSDLSPQLVIEDFGRGLSRDELKLFGQFGASSKRDTNEQIGGFGLGSKSGLAIASQFTVTAVKDGKQNTVIIKRRDDGHPMMSFLDERDVDASVPNGVRVTIPSSDTRRFLSAIEENFFLGWEPGSVLVNGYAPGTHLSVHDTALFTDLDGLGWKPRKDTNTRQAGIGSGYVIALVDAVRYRLDSDQVDSINEDLRRGFLKEVVIKLENGSVEIHPSRETLIYDKRTREYINAQVKALVEVGKKQYQADIDAATNIREALAIRRKAISYGFGKDYTFRGEPIVLDAPDRVKRDGTDLVDLKFTEASIGHGSRTDYQANRSGVSYSALLAHKFDQLSNLQIRTVLVYGASDPKDIRNRTLHAESNGAVQWATATAESEQDVLATQAAPGASVQRIHPTDFTLYFTSEKRLNKLNKWVLGSFERIISADEYMAVVTEVRKAAAKIARDNYKSRAVAPDKTELRVLAWREYGRSYYHTRSADSLDAAATHVLLKNGSDDITDRIRASIMTNVGFQGDKGLNEVVKHLVRRGVVFILANKNQKTDDYINIIPNLRTDFMGVVEDHVASLVSSKTEAQKRAAKDRTTRGTDWASSFPKKFLPQVASVDLRLWLEAMSAPQTEDDAFLTHLAKFGASFGFDSTKAQFESTITVSPAEKFPLLKNYATYGADWKALIEYVNLLTEDYSGLSWVRED
jgi:hypothetical protein